MIKTPIVSAVNIGSLLLYEGNEPRTNMMNNNISGMSAAAIQEKTISIVFNVLKVLRGLRFISNGPVFLFASERSIHIAMTYTKGIKLETEAEVEKKLRAVVIV